MTGRKIKYTETRQAIEYGRRRIEYVLTYADRRTLKIDVHPDQSVRVIAPLGKAPQAVKERVQRRANWIVRQLDYFERFQPLPLAYEYVSGETHTYLGRRYRLKVVESDRNEVKLIGRFLYVYTSLKSSNGYTEKLVRAWYDEHARHAIDRRLARCLERARRAGIPEPTVRYRPMKRRWGSCAKSGVLTFNTELVKAPVDCVDYVIMHELCHLKHRNHSPAFWRLLTRLMPDWERRKERLERMVV